MLLFLFASFPFALSFNSTRNLTNPGFLLPLIVHIILFQRNTSPNNFGCYSKLANHAYFAFVSALNQKPIVASAAVNLAKPLALPGQPIGGIVVKGGKNPGGSMTDLMVDDKGTIRFDMLDAGDYKFIISLWNLLPGYLDFHYIRIRRNVI